jgi:hypothetical protein
MLLPPKEVALFFWYFQSGAKAKKEKSGKEKGNAEMPAIQFEVWSNWNFEDSCNKADNLYLQPKKLTM